MTGVQYTSLAYVFAGTVLIGYAVKLWWSLRSTTRCGSGDKP